MINGELPQYLYKYTSVDILNKILQSGELFFSSVISFNDPFDINPNKQYGSTDEIIKWISCTHPLTIDKQKEMLKNREELKILLEKEITNKLNTIGVCCFTEKNDDILMWAHYADSYKGVCLKFNIDKLTFPLIDKSNVMKPCRVSYKQNLPIFKIPFYSNNEIHEILYVKYKEWEYEKEYRIINPYRKGLESFPKEALTEIIFGCNCLPDDIKCVQNNALNYGFSHLKYKQITLSDKEYRLIITDLKEYSNTTNK